MKRSQKVTSLVLALVLALGLVMPTLAVDAAPTVTAVNGESSVTVGYKETKQSEFEAANLPAGAAVHVFLNGEDQGEAVYLYVNEPTADYTVEAKVLDEGGRELATSGVISVTVKNGPLDRAAAFFKNTVLRAVDGIADVIGSFFVSILYFFDGLIH